MGFSARAILTAVCAAAQIGSVACSAEQRAPQPAGTASPVRGMVFVAGPMVETKHGWIPYRDVRAYRDGRLSATYVHRVLPARDRAAASLLFDEVSKTARPIGGGPVRRFDPCPERTVIGKTVELSPSGRAALCIDEWSEKFDGNRLVVFDPLSPRATRRVIFTSRMSDYHQAAWIDEHRIAVTEYAKAGCQRLPLTWATTVTIVDPTGRVLQRGGPCVHGVIAGPRGLVLMRYRYPDVTPLEFLSDVLRIERRRVLPYFSIDRGGTWTEGYPQFYDGDGRVVYYDRINDNGRLYAGGRPLALRDVHGAVWAKP